MINDAENQIILIDLEYPRRRNHIFSELYLFTRDNMIEVTQQNK